MSYTTEKSLFILSREYQLLLAGQDQVYRGGTIKEGVLSLGKRCEKRNSILGEQHGQPGSMTDTCPIWRIIGVFQCAAAKWGETGSDRQNWAKAVQRLCKSICYGCSIYNF